MAKPYGNFFFQSGGGGSSGGTVIPGTGFLNVVTVTSGGYTATSSNNVILASGGAYVVTLPQASGSTGQILDIKKTDSSLSNIITIFGNGANIDGNTSTTLNTINEQVSLTCDGFNWWILSRVTKTAPTSYTPTFNAFGTVTVSNFVSYRDGKYLNITGNFTAGTPGASGAAVSIGFGGTNLPSVLLMDFTALASASMMPVGNYCTRNTGGIAGFMTATVGLTSLFFCQPFGASASVQVTQTNGSVLGGGSNQPVVGPLVIPIQGWNN